MTTTKINETKYTSHEECKEREVETIEKKMFYKKS